MATVFRPPKVGRMDFLLGIDGGGTRTRAILVTETGVVLGTGEAGPANCHNVGVQTAARHLNEAADMAWSAADKPRRQQPARVFIGCAGVKSRPDILQLTAAAELAGFPAETVTVENDLHNALAGGLGGRPGIALIAGTGSNCLGRDASGNTFMCGGWGWLLDDEGSGFGLAIAALRAVARAADRRARPTSLLPAALAFFGVSEPDELLARFYAKKWTPGEVAAFAPVVMRHATEGDATARKLLAEGARALAALVSGAASALRFPQGPRVVLLGGCARGGAPYQPMIEAKIRATCPRARIVEPVGPPLHGAALNVLRAAGIHPLPRLDFSQTNALTDSVSEI
ncbi:MAG: ATPase [Opitutaceae bacterium]|jgi:N-acetylglucosamine kinase-like BadF-type ATPase|nr:ATPase [Opitutaceae bacterium]